ncbi:MAG: AAA ATPase midasin [Sclerophora amabilis]|nr:MAG: AAA ATPase midasin [Sclerophora amabilis]
MDCSWSDRQFCADQRVVVLPQEILHIIRNASNAEYLDTLAGIALDPRLTAAFFTHYEPIIVDICNRWIATARISFVRSLSVVSAIARLLPFAPHLAIYLEKVFLSRFFTQNSNNECVECFRYLSSQYDYDPNSLEDSQLQDLLLSAFRLLGFDNEAFAPAISPSRLVPLFRRKSRPVRCLAIRVFCSSMHAADATIQRILKQYLGDGPIEGEWERKAIDFRFLGLWEARRIEVLGDELRQIREQRRSISMSENKGRVLLPEDFSSLTAPVAGVLLPRLSGTSRKSSALILTSTTTMNISKVASALLLPNPVLLTGLGGSGKTSTILNLASEMNVQDSMLSLHLNEETDAKLLIGMYTMGKEAGSLEWRPGVLTTAVKEGRWVLIEDLDRAPAEVTSVLLPLIERGELLVPSRGETVRAPRGFKLIATMRTMSNSKGEETLPVSTMLGGRHWRRVAIKSPNLSEFHEIIGTTFPLLRVHLPVMISVYEKLQELFQTPLFAAKTKSLIGRPLGPRDLLRWSRRSNTILESSDSQTAAESISEQIHDDIFMEAVNCFSAAFQNEEARKDVIAVVGKEMAVAPTRVNFYMQTYVPRLFDTKETIVIGRARLSKAKQSNGDFRKVRKATTEMPFANTSHSLRVIEQIGTAVQMMEPVLLIGETGTGKTAAIQHLARLSGHRLTAINLSQQSESGDLLGGFKPASARSLVMPMKEEFDDLFDLTFSSTRNERYLTTLAKSIARGQWSRVVALWNEAAKMVEAKFSPETVVKSTSSNNGETHQPSKRRKLKFENLEDVKIRWGKFVLALQSLEKQINADSKGMAFSFVEGKIVQAVRKGEWVLLDEINLASPDTLESIADLLYAGSDGSPSILLSETGDIERVKAHPAFRIFAAMNPATDVGKRDLPPGLRSRFTEIYVESPDRDQDSLMHIIKAYLGSFNDTDASATYNIAQTYSDIKRLADQNRLVDGANQKPQFSLRTLTRTLTYVAEIAPIYGLRRAIYEGFSMSFLTLLDKMSESLVLPLIEMHILGSHRNARSLLSQIPRPPNDGYEYVQFEHYWLRKGIYATEEQLHYIITPFIRRNLLNLVRAASTRQFPVLLQGPTSSGKTSLIEYLAKLTGNKFVRINNHDHTDLQEYLGSYVSGEDGQIQFQEGLLVEALRQGHWIVLDELNLAPTDILEALNRLLDDNRELLIPETQEVVRPHPNFMLFATQNPPGLYGGRKVLSRAFRNRFLELHFDDIPENELETILRERSQIAPSFCVKIVTVYKELSILRQSNRLFEQRDSFATLRDLFRWALRKADDRDQLAANGYMLLAERVRNFEERSAVRGIIEKVFKVKVDEDLLYGNVELPNPSSESGTGHAPAIIWTKAMRRLFVLVSQALKHDEPVLLVGETGCGKTSICQVLAQSFGKALHILNAHQNTETGDMIGAQRPVRNRSDIQRELLDDLQTAFVSSGHKSFDKDLDGALRAFEALNTRELEKIPLDLYQRIRKSKSRYKSLFEWSDGILVSTMKTGQFFLLDEISLADDSVLERLNSVLEPQRCLLLAEKGSTESLVTAADGFQFLATMNPGGDFGKRELSPALRNRFTEIWVPPVTESNDVLQIVEAKLRPPAKRFALPLVQFAQWFAETFNSSSGSSISIRDVLAWVNFINCYSKRDSYSAVLHGAAMVFIDALGANPAAMIASAPIQLEQAKNRCLDYLSNVLEYDVSSVYSEQVEVVLRETEFSVGEFSISKVNDHAHSSAYNLQAPTTTQNALRVIRAMQLPKPILMEGNPGVGKTTLIATLASIIGQPLVRINLSEQTDLMDLFGSDVPIEGAEPGNFAWRDAPFLRALKNGSWVLLDEMNLASQSVLEGLNACLDHRGEVYVAELDRVFYRHPQFKIFAAQNPHHQGGGRKGLPTSFVNRFTVVYADLFKHEDAMLICSQKFSNLSCVDIQKVVYLVSNINSQVGRQGRFGSHGGPWEFNLRDILRLLTLSTSQEGLLPAGGIQDFFDLVITHRFRTKEDKAYVETLFEESFGESRQARHYYHNLSRSSFQVGLALLKRDPCVQHIPRPPFVVSEQRLALTESIMICVQKDWPCLLVGTSGSGKTTLIRNIASVVGAELVEFPLNSDMDTIDLIGGYEQVDYRRQAISFLGNLVHTVQASVLNSDFSSHLLAHLTPLLFRLKVVEWDAIDYQDILNRLSQISRLSPQPQIESLIWQCKEILQKPHHYDKACFEWVDGVLVDTLKKGKWLVLDNANLCNSSVLDRLNSLLEPNGTLTINEHHTTNGDARVIEPHPNFRLFLTMEPRYGELSRAMRNRTVEIFVMPYEGAQALQENQAQTHLLEAPMYRYNNLRALSGPSNDNEVFPSLAESGLYHLCLSDLRILRTWREQVDAGLLELSEERRLELTGALDIFCDFAELMGQPTLPRPAGDEEKISKMLGIPEFQESQAIHPLLNDSFLRLYSNNDDLARPYWTALAQELVLKALSMDRGLRVVAERASLLKLSQMSRLERSSAFLNTPDLSHDNSGPIFPFLLGIEKSLLGLVSSCKISQGNPSWAWSMRTNIVLLWWSTFDLCSSAEFDDAVFQVHLGLWQDLVTRANRLGQFFTSIAATIDQGLGTFKSFWQLSTGLSMEKLWPVLRSTSCSSSSQLHSQIRMEDIAKRFDSVLWKADISVEQKVALQTSVVQVLQNISNHDHNLGPPIEDIHEAVSALEKLHEDNESVAPLYETEFEGLCQYFDVLQWQCSPQISSENTAIDSRVMLFSKRPTRDLSAGRMIPISASQILSDMSRAEVHDIPLKQLDLVQDEIETLNRALSQSSNVLHLGQLRAICQCLFRILHELFDAHKDLMHETFLQRLQIQLSGLLNPKRETVVQELDASDHWKVPPSHHFRQITEAYFLPAINILEKVKFREVVDVSKAWILASVGCLLLYVPDQKFDPSLKPLVERRLYIQRRECLLAEIKALKRFETSFTGQSFNLRCKILEEALRNLGEEPPTEAFTRPNFPTLGQVQNEFSNTINSIVRPLQDNISLDRLLVLNHDSSQDARVLQMNIAQSMRRLSEEYRGYDDITKPVYGFLNMLNIGISLTLMMDRKSCLQSIPTTATCSQTPFLGATPQNICDGVAGIDLILTEHPSFRLHFLKWLSVVKHCQSSEGFRRHEQKLHKVYQDSYGEWKVRLGLLRENEVSRSSLYHYRNGQEESEEADEKEFNDLFPDYERVNISDPIFQDTSASPRDVSIQLYNLHSGIYKSRGLVAEDLLSLIEDSVASMARSHHQDNTTSYGVNLSRSLLPGSILYLDQIHKSLQPRSVDDPPNFYKDANVTEARKLAVLVQRVQMRFSHIQRSWPEHATLQDVLTTCDELLAFRYTEPVAKFLTKVEKLHDYVHEWQVVASKEFSTADLRDEIRSKIIEWRRLELSTWPRLLEMEQQKCNDDAKSWWFIAYEAVVALPMSLIDAGESLDEHSVELASTLQIFLASTSLGQFCQRLRLLEQIEHHLLSLRKRHHSIAPICDMLAYFNSHCLRYEPQICETIRNGRLAIERDMKEVVLLASWKDTNITALRESAKRSHHKLFKLVRKFRALLGRAVGDIFFETLPEIHSTIGPTNHFQAPHSVPEIDSKAVKLCTIHVADWPERPAHLINTSNTVSTMHSVGQAYLSKMEGFQLVDGFTSNLVASLKELRKQTPSTLTNENKETVKYLKTRKRKVFADTLKQIKQMGLKHNIGGRILEAQATLPLIIAKLKVLPKASRIQNVEAIDYHLHQTLSLMPTARLSLRNHSEDLTGTELARCVGYLESLLALLLKQRSTLVTSTSVLMKLDSLVDESRRMWMPEQYNLQSTNQARESEYEVYQQSVTFLPSILEVGSHIVEVYARFGRLDTSFIEDGLKAWKSKFENLLKEWKALPVFRERVSSTRHTSLIDKTKSALKELSSQLREWSAQQPLTSFILEQIVQWTLLDLHHKTDSPSPEIKESGGSDRSNVADVDKALSKTVDCMLVALQGLQRLQSQESSTIEENLWLMRQDSMLRAALTSLHALDITRLLEEAFSKLTHSNGHFEQKSLSVAAALFHTISPVFQQYSQIYYEVVQRYGDFHRSTCEMTHQLLKSFTQLASQGFCTPSEQGDSNDDNAEKVEGGPGLGEGEGAEDISKNVGDNEDLSELAQEPGDARDEKEIEDEKDAVDIDDDLEGQMGDISDNAEDDDDDRSQNEEGEDDIDEEAGAIDNLDPDAVDEKMWDGNGEKMEKEQEGKESKGKADNDDTTAAQQDGRVEKELSADDEDEDVESANASENETVEGGAENPETQVQEGDTLELPEDMDLNGDEGANAEEKSDDDLDDFSNQHSEEGELDMDRETDSDSAEHPGNDLESKNSEPDVSETGSQKKDDENDTRDNEAPVSDVDMEDVSQKDDANPREDDRNEAPADAGLASSHNPYGDGDVDHQSDQTNDIRDTSDAAQRKEGQMDASSQALEDTCMENGQAVNDANQSVAEAQQKLEKQDPDIREQAFKKLGDALNKWHRQRKPIQEASELQQRHELANEHEAEKMDFEHLRDEDTAEDTQALGAATKDQARALDDSMAIDSKIPEMVNDVDAPRDEKSEETYHDNEAQIQNTRSETEPQSEDIRAGAIIGSRGSPGQQYDESFRLESEDHQDLSKVDTHLSTIDLNSLPDSQLSDNIRDVHQLWSHYESLTRPLSLALTEQLRLILAPTLATKMRGDFRTGKRLNIKRIIPYIASQYKRDKIWMRRSVPTKRAYQVMLAVDDSKSMAENSAGHLALETLVMVARSLAMLEVGQICVLAFGEYVKVAHEFNLPFSNEAGTSMLKDFDFQQPKTDVKKMLQKSLEVFRTAKMNPTTTLSGGAADLWQLQLIISDGLCEDHDAIRRMVRQAQEERIMIVFVIVDNIRAGEQGEQIQTGASSKGKGREATDGSIMEMTQAKFEDDGKGGLAVKMERYLDGFPFPYYLIVGDVRELPGVLAIALRQWFGEVASAT